MNSSAKALTQIPVGRFARIHRLHSEPGVSSRLREMGFCEDAVVRMVVNGDGNLICEVCHTRIGINHSIAHHILVTPLE